MKIIPLTDKGRRRLEAYAVLNMNKDFWEKLEKTRKHPLNEKFIFALKSLVDYGLVGEIDFLDLAFERIIENIRKRDYYFEETGEQVFLNAFELVYQDYIKDNFYNWKIK